MFYRFKCPVCRCVHTLEMGMNDVHEHSCCGVECARLYEGVISFTEPFYSDELGEMVSSRHDWERKKEEQRYRHQTDKDLYGYTNTKDEWREKYRRTDG